MTKAAPRIPGVYRHVMIVVECREGASAAVAEGVDMARRHGARVTFVLTVPELADVIVEMSGFPVVSSDAAAREVARYGAQLLNRALTLAAHHGVTAHAVAIDALDVSGGIAQRAHEDGADVIVVACEPVNALVRLLNGSLVPGLVTAATVPVVVCRDKAPTAPTRRRRARHGREGRSGEADGSPKLRPS